MLGRMSWFYVTDSQEKLAVEEDEFPALARTGAVRPQTLIWKEGLKDWASCGELKPEIFSTPAGNGAGVGRDETGSLLRQATRPLCAAWAWLVPVQVGVLSWLVLNVLSAIMAGRENETGMVWKMIAGVVALAVLLGLLFHWMTALRTASRTASATDVRAASKAGAAVLKWCGAVSIAVTIILSFDVFTAVVKSLAGLP